ncbi:pyridoxamine 5'-phosphate oxidase family protein [Massilia sp. Dwa41.01b]|uniref:pyridoxamine 5'-phosphate oxidase family protein n=1 Tax=unclassified Massilia TaxID=2609279 RepID=UPI00160319FF|nr:MULTISPECIES: pyridoxamine 5'-phosphate oxidase family protein [unclassified Massilia]QNA89691.1 pyridoxamine 5'-phosphate oxidase family protein [Massilia sp. Dwa41.01b]QNB00586.1 pyridoxamine 5'-phosphate oxidase family protein [Massilia sp. Se16.2.3]
MSSHLITDLAALESLFGPVAPPSIAKETDRLHPVYARWIEQARFALLSTSGPQGLDVSPRGDAGHLVRIVDEHTLLLPERRGNNRIDSLRNLIADPRIGLLFLIPGVGETLRVRGQAEISVAPDLLDSFAVEGKRPICVLRVAVEKVFFQCARAILRSRLWHVDEHDRSKVPTPGKMLAELTAGFDGDSYDRALPQRQRDSLY